MAQRSFVSWGIVSDRQTPCRPEESAPGPMAGANQMLRSVTSEWAFTDARRQWQVGVSGVLAVG